MIAELSELVEAAKRFDPDAIEGIKSLLDTHPGIWEHYSDLASHVATRWINLLAGDDECIRESLVRRVEQLRAEILGDEGGTVLEQLLAERIVAAWLMIRFFDLALGQAAEGSRASHVRYLQQQIDRSQRRYVAAVKGLAELRTLLRESSSNCQSSRRGSRPACTES